VTYAAQMAQDLAARARTVQLQDGDVLVAEGDVADEVFLLLDGQLEATNSSPYGEVVVARMEAGQMIGEVSVIAGGRRSATLRASRPADVLVIGRADFEGWLDRNPEIADAVSEQARERIDRSQVASMVTEVMGATDTALVREIVDRVRWRRLEVGEVLFRQDDPSDAAYFIVGGRVSVVIRDEYDAEHKVRELGRGEVVGELGLLDRAPRSATVQAVRDTTLAELSTRTFEELVSRYPALMLHVSRGILGRLKRPPRRIVDRAASLAVAVTAPVEPAPLVRGLLTEIARHGTVKHLSSVVVDDLLHRSGISQATVDNIGVPRLAEFMHEADVGNDHVVLETDREMTAWTRRALRQADRVVILASPRPDPEERRRIREILDAIAGVTHVARMLAVLHPRGVLRPRETASLVGGLGVDEVVHLRSGSDEDLARLGRLATGHGVGLVLSGGGARGFAHIGAYHALREAGIPVDQVAGCSMGAVIAAAIAIGIPEAELEEVAERQFHRLLDYTLPVVSLLKGERISRNLQQTFGGWDIEDLWLPFYCVSTNLTHSRLEVHRRGDAARAIRASAAIPGILPPVPFDGDLLVDGGVLNNLPVEMMRQDGTIGTVIAIDVAMPQGPGAGSDFGMSVSGFRALAASVTGRRSDYPRLSAVLLRSMLTGAVRNQHEAMKDATVDLLLPLHLPGVGLLDFERVRAVSRAGYVASAGSIREWAATQRWVTNGT
jgi:predicted acylesterase/phospholipase RssA/CRP-like cAMP-binding protein